ncbi:MAG TPA: protein-export chaperone SecB [Puia sp.]|nr:protein-export chaperone SecB [Puia sp.]
MEITEQIKLRFKGVDFPSVQIKSFKAYQESEDHKMQVNIQPKVFIPKESQNTFNIIMQIDLVVQDFFILNITAIGLFELSQETVTDEVRKSFINENSPAIMFPYVRSFISTLTSNLGKVTTPIILPTRFFKGELEESVQ